MNGNPQRNYDLLIFYIALEHVTSLFFILFFCLNQLILKNITIILVMDKFVVKNYFSTNSRQQNSGSTMKVHADVHHDVHGTTTGLSRFSFQSAATARKRKRFA